MSDELSSEDLARLGLRPEDLGPECKLELPARRVALGAPAAVAFAFEDAADKGFTETDFVEAPADVVESLGGRIEFARDEPRVIKFIPPAGESYSVRSVRGRREAISHEDETGVLFIDLRSGPIRLAGPAGAGLVLSFPSVADHMWICLISGRPLDVRPLEAIEAPLSDWCARCDDRWLVARIREREKRHDSWETAAAAGMLARLVEPPSPASARAIVESLLAGGRYEPLSAPRQWVRKLEKSKLATIQDLALAVVDSLFGRLQELSDNFEPANSGWQEDLLRILKERDDLEGVHLLLLEAQRGIVLGEALESLDEAGSRFIRSLPLRLEFSDTRLRRARDREPNAWWTSLSVA